MLSGTTTGILDRNTCADLKIEPTASPRAWYGHPLDLGRITTALWCADQRPPNQN